MQDAKRVKTVDDPDEARRNMVDVYVRNNNVSSCDEDCPCFKASDPHCAKAWKTAFVNARDTPTGPNMKAIANLRAMIWFQTEYYIACTLKADPTFFSEVQTTAVRCPTRKRKFCGTCYVEVVEEDMLDVASKLVQEGKSVAVLNMANAFIPGGGVRRGKGAQEENIHRRTDAFRFLEQQPENYPIPLHKCLVSSEVTVLRGSEADGYPFRHPFRITLLSCAAVAKPVLTETQDYANHADRRCMQRKISAIMEAAVQTGCDSVVLSAFGCGAFGNPPEIVSQIFRYEIDYIPVKNIIFSIIDDHNAARCHNPRGNFLPFKETFGQIRDP